MKRSHRALSLFTVAVLLVVAGLGWMLLGRREALGHIRTGDATSEGLVAVATERDFTPRVQSTGSVRLAPGARIEVGARVSGVVRSLAVTQGSRVRAGDLIARLDAREAEARLAQAEARVAELETAAGQSATDLARLEALGTVKAISDQEVLTGRSGLLLARARLEGARADRELARVQLDYTVIRSPIAGIVATVTTHEGETVAASLAAPTFVTLIDPSRLECVALVDEADIGHVAAGDTAEFSVDAYPGRIFRGVVARVASDATIVGGVVDYEVTIRMRGDIRDLKPQMTASVSIDGAPIRALIVPTAAVRQSPQETYVWRRHGGAPERVPVQLGARQSDVAEVRAGLARGDTVLTAGFPDVP